MARWEFTPDFNLIHLAVEGSVGGTSLGLHVAADTISNGGRVLWVGENMPDNNRFSQLFEHLSLIDSSRFHAMSLSGAFDKAIDSVIRAIESLPSVKLVVLDDWCPSTGPIPITNIEHISRLLDDISTEILLVLISKSTIDASGSRSGSVFARGEKKMKDLGFSIYTLSRPKDGSSRTLANKDLIQDLFLTQSGFDFKN